MFPVFQITGCSEEHRYFTINPWAARNGFSPRPRHKTREKTLSSRAESSSENEYADSICPETELFGRDYNTPEQAESIATYSGVVGRPNIATEGR